MSIFRFYLVLVWFPMACSVGQTKLDSLNHIARNTIDTTALVDALNQSSYLLRNTNSDTVIILSEQSEELSKTINYDFGIASAKFNRAIVLTSKGQYYQALELLQEARTIFQKEGKKRQLASVINSIGRVYNFIEDYDQALNYYKQSASLSSELDDPQWESTILNNIGHIHKLQENFDEALNTLNSAIQKVSIVSDQLYPFYNKGSVFLALSKYDSAHHYLSRSARIAQQIQDNYVLSLSMIDFGKMYLETKQLDQAKTALLRAFEISEKADLKNEQRDAAKLLSKVYENQNQPELALQFYKKYTNLNSALFDADLTRRMAFQEAEFVYKERIAMEQAVRKGAELQQKRDLDAAIWTRNTLIAGIVFLLLICYLLVINFRRKRLANKALRALNIRIEEQSEELKRANLEITVMNSNLEKIVNQRTKELKKRNKQLKEYLSSNSHIVRAPLARILGLVDLYEPARKENLDFINESLQVSAKELDDALREINRLLSDESSN